LYVEIVFHGRGGQGGVTAANILAGAAVREGKWSQSFPHFGAERRGAPVRAYARISDRPILRHSQISKADVSVVLDSELFNLTNIIDTVKDNGIIVANAPDDFRVDIRSSQSLFCVNATQIARELKLIVAGWPVVNTSMLGALVKATPIVSLDSILAEIKSYWPGKPGELNAEAAKRAFERTVKCI
jgi:pyruvate ferredoxin oxidoreductase gamma subunit